MTKNAREPSRISKALFGRLRSYHYTTHDQRIQLKFRAHTGVKWNELKGYNCELPEGYARRLVTIHEFKLALELEQVAKPGLGIMQNNHATPT